MAAKPLRLPVDTNVLLDLADEVEDVLDALSVIDRRLPEADGLVPPSVLDELAYLCDSGQTRQVRESARKALRQLREEKRFRPLLELLLGEEVAESLAADFRQRGLLPAEELHEALILAEAALLNCGMSLTSDEHLRGIDHEEPTLVLHPHGLAAPVIATPREIVRKFFR
ncbi:MAG: type II toxin-antitoxin system VapC family toxin [Verrucomicrobia bacterium]|nr:type II toxin-antitoxin system VapC family toxin [Verrucomicrobiota bacterium]